MSVPVKLISKTGTYDEANKKINWTITVNESGRTIDNAVVTDTIPAGLKLDPETIKVGDTSESADAAAPTTVSYTFTDYATESTFSHSLGKITGPRVIKFSTAVNPEVYNHNNEKDNQYINTAYINGSGILDESGTGKGTPGTGTVPVPTSIISKSGSYDASAVLLPGQLL